MIKNFRNSYVLNKVQIPCLAFKSLQNLISPISGIYDALTKFSYQISSEQTLGFLVPVPPHATYSLYLFSPALYQHYISRCHSETHLKCSLLQKAFLKHQLIHPSFSAPILWHRTLSILFCGYFLHVSYCLVHFNSFSYSSAYIEYYLVLRKANKIFVEMRHGKMTLLSSHISTLNRLRFPVSK